MRNKGIFKILVILFLLQTPVFASNLCSSCCNFNDFFKCNYKELVEYLSPNDETRRIFDMLFTAYSIKFEGLDFEYKARCEELCKNENLDEISPHCIREQKRYIRGLAEIAEEEYDNFLDDLSFEICGCENVENKAIKRHKKRYIKALKKQISRKCK